MKWRSSVKSRTFVLALHDYYLDQAAATAVRHYTNETEGVDHSKDDTKLGGELIHNSDDDWCLQYLTVFHVPSVMEAFDDDASGYVKIKEVNEFTNAIPPTWNLLRWLAYWSEGWKVEVIKYSRRILQILAKTVEVERHVLPENCSNIQYYLNRPPIGIMQRLIRSADDEISSEAELLDLVHTTMESEIAKWDNILKAGKYEVDSTESFMQLSRGRRVESYLFPALYVILRHHLRLIKLARSKVLASEELRAAERTIFFVLGAAYDRRKQFEESFRQKQLDPTAQFKYLARGIFSGVENQNTDMDRMSDTEYVSGRVPNDHPEAKEEEDLLTNEAEPTGTILKCDLYGVRTAKYFEPWTRDIDDLAHFRPTDLEKDLPRPKALWRFAIKAVLEQVKAYRYQRTWAAMKRRRDLRIEYLNLSLKETRYQEFTDEHVRRIPTETPEPLTPDESKRIDDLADNILHERDAYFYNSLYGLVLRRDVGHARTECDGCKQWPIHGVRYLCLECPIFNFCNSCEKNPPPFDGGHKINHAVIKIPWPIPVATVQVYKSRASDIFAKYSSADGEEPIQGENTPGNVDNQGTVVDVLFHSAAEDEAAEVESAPPPAPATSFSCKAGCGRDNLIVRCICLDCNDEYTLCHDCDEVLTTNHVHKIDGIYATGAIGSNPLAWISDDATSANLQSSAAENHHERHIVLKIKELRRSVDEKPDEVEEDHGILISKLRDDVVSRFGSVEQRFDNLRDDVASRFGSVEQRFNDLELRFTKLETSFTKLEVLMGQIASHLRPEK